MAQEEEIVIIEDSDAEEVSEGETKEEISSDEPDKKKLLIFGGIAIVLVLILTIVTVLLVVKIKKKKQTHSATPSTIEKKLTQSQQKKIEPTKLEQLIAKANYLYTTGQKEQALKIYEYIAQYSEAISEYNLGVAKLKNKQYAQALQNFNKAIENGEKRCVSAINAAVCSLHLKRYEDFKYYIDLAEAYLPNEINSPLYPYYYSLIKFYHQNYFEALSSINKVSQQEYQVQKNELQSKLSALFGNNYQAIEALEDIHTLDIPFNKALLYANIGDLALAKSNFEDAILKGFYPHRATLGLIYTKIKLGQIKSAVEDLNNANKKYGDALLDPYPLSVFIKPSLFDPLQAQIKYRNSLKEDPSVLFQILFYFSPYKIFNANQTINYIRKGNATSYIDSVESAQSFLQKGASTSNVNQGIAQAIKKALHFKVREANEILKKLVKIQPKHAILHYDLALTYAQLGDMRNAYKHFIWSYHLDAKNYLSGIYAYMASKLALNEDRKLLQTLKESIILEEDKEHFEFYKTLLQVAQEHYLATVDWLDNQYKTRPIYLALSHIIALSLKQQDKAIKKAKQLVTLLPNEILPHLLYINAKLFDENKPNYAKESAKYIQKQHFIYKDFFYGATITKDLFIQEQLLTGRIYKTVKLLQDEIEKTSQKDTKDMELALAQALFYNKNFEESYVEYNHIIDELKVQDPKTLFLAAISAIKADHHENAIALLELAKLKDRTSYETRYALALLYFEINNARGAAIELNKIPSFNFHSKYFNFDIDLKKLTFKQQHPNEK